MKARIYRSVLRGGITESLRKMIDSAESKMNNRVLFLNITKEKGKCLPELMKNWLLDVFKGKL
jgi:hypothetical protein